MRAVLVFAVCTIAVAIAAPQYTTKYDNVNLDDIISNDRLMKNYVDCLLGKSKCTPDGAELKKVLPDALQTECSKCSEKQKNGSKKIIEHLVNNKTEWWDQLGKVYDPTGEFKKKYQYTAEKVGIKV